MDIHMVIHMDMDMDMITLLHTDIAIHILK